MTHYSQGLYYKITLDSPQNEMFHCYEFITGYFDT